MAAFDLAEPWPADTGSHRELDLQKTRTQAFFFQGSELFHAPRNYDNCRRMTRRFRVSLFRRASGEVVVAHRRQISSLMLGQEIVATSQTCELVEFGNSL